MKSKFSKICAAIVAATMLCSNASVVAAAESGVTADIVAPCYEIAQSAKSELSVSGTTATCVSRAAGTNTVKITAEQTLQKQGLFWIWGDVDGASWTKTVSLSSIAMSNSKTGLDSGTYRLKTVFTLTASNGTTETITVYSDEKTI